MANLASANISIFPYGSTRASHVYSRVLNEQNITSIIKSITDKPSYVISYDSTSKLIKFVIEGYLIEANIEGVTTSGSKLYAAIKIDNTTSGSNHLEGTDELPEGSTETVFNGVSFVTEEELKNGNAYTHMLQLLDPNGDVHTDSFLKFNSSSLPAAAKTPTCYQCSLGVEWN